MHFRSSIVITALAGIAAAGPIETRQLGLGGTGSTSKEFSQGGCKDILFAWARGSTEIGNMVRSPTHSTPPPISLTPPGHRRRPPNLRRPEEGLRRQRSSNRRHLLRSNPRHKRHPRRHRQRLQTTHAEHPNLHGAKMPRLHHRNRRLLPRRSRQPPRDRIPRRGRQRPNRRRRPLRRHPETTGQEPDPQLPRGQGQDHLSAWRRRLFGYADGAARASDVRGARGRGRAVLGAAGEECAGEGQGSECEARG